MLASLVLAMLAASGDGQVAPPKESVAVLPVQNRAVNAGPAGAEALLSTVLAQHLGALGDFNVISTDEVAALLESEEQRQRTGCNDDGCLAEIAGALGARYLVLGEVQRLGRRLAWTATLLDQRAGSVVRRIEVRGGSVQALAALGREVALGLSGRDATVELRGEDARRQLGFADAEGLAKFAEYRRKHEELTTGEALTAFIIDRNGESNLLAAAEAALYAVAGGATFLAFAAVGIGAMMPVVAPLAWPLAVLAPLGCPFTLVALGATLAALGLSAVDAFDVGRVPVARAGCCRDDAEIEDAAAATAWERATALATLMVAPAIVVASFLVGPGLGVAAAARGSNPDLAGGVYGMPAPAFFMVIGSCCAGMACTWPVACFALSSSLGSGLATLLWPARPLLDSPDRESLE